MTGNSQRSRWTHAENAEVRPNPIVAGDADVGQTSVGGNELLADFLMSEIQLDLVFPAQPIRRSCSSTSSLPAYPAADQVSIVRVAAPEPAVVAEEAVPM
jgi:hypothetical protein